MIDRDDIKAAVREAVAESLANHPCQFLESERAALHRIAELDRDHIDALRMIGRAVSGTAARVGQFIAICLLAAAIYAAVALLRLGIARP